MTISMIEIYNEKVHDLLSSESKRSAGLPVRQTAGGGFFVQGLKIVPVGSYNDIEERMKQGIVFVVCDRRSLVKPFHLSPP